MTERQQLANANYQALLKKRDELAANIANAAGEPDRGALNREYDAVIIHLEEAIEECKQADAAAFRGIK